MSHTLITGACGGLGRAFVEASTNNNENMILVGTNQQKLNSLKSEIEAKHKLDILCFVCDQSKINQITELFENLKDKQISKAILNAGYIDEGSISQKSQNELLGVIQTNCEGTVAIAKQLFDKATQSNQKLELLVTSSLSAYYPMPQMAIYAASKSFLLHYFLAAREEYKKNGIKITVLCPGGIPTTQAMKDAIAAQGFGGKLSSNTPEEVAKCGLRALSKNKPVAIPGCFNKFLKWAGTRPSKSFVAKQIGKRWQKSQQKRNIK